MDLKKKLMTSIMTMSLAAALVGGATFAYFSGTATNADNAFAAGDLTITTEPTSAVFNATNIYPGWSETQDLTVVNSGDMNFNFKIASSMVTGESAALYGALTCEIKDGTNVLYTGPISGVATSDISLPLDDATTAGLENKKALTFKVSFPDDGSDQNALQGLSTKVNFTFNAKQ